jgi:hypothetical protein
MFAATNLAVGTAIEVEFRPVGEKASVCACAIVRRKAVYLYGMEFLDEITSAVAKSSLVQTHSREIN